MPPAPPTPPMTPNDIARVQAFLRKLFSNDTITVDPPAKAGQSAEINVAGELIGTLHRDDDEGEVSYDVHMVILEEDLPPAAPARKR
ncbi:MAG: DUF3126 family protein [Azospirillaceae bacterium]|nr:DUF3126 family protein [Azospirillaceae bacterium]